MILYTQCKGIKRDDLIIQQDEDGQFYVQSVALLDMGRFKTLSEAESHKTFLEEQPF